VSRFGTSLCVCACVRVFQRMIPFVPVFDFFFFFFFFFFLLLFSSARLGRDLSYILGLRWEFRADGLQPG